MIKQSNLEHIKESAHAVIHPIYKDKNACTRVSGILDYNFRNQINKDLGALTQINTLGKIGFEQLYFVGMGYVDESDIHSIQEGFAKGLKNIDESHLVVDLKRVVTDNISFKDAAYAFTKSYYLSTYNYKEVKQREIELIAKEDITDAINQAKVEAEAINRARTLANAPSNLLTPLDLEAKAIELFKDEPVEISILGNKELLELKAGGILGVNQGSALEARLIVLKYEGQPGSEFTALVGKGVTFDTGGYNLKPSASMANMKSDMHGAASVLGAFEIIVKQELKANVYCVIPTTENMIDGNAYKADDVLVMMNGKRVEITNTDAEGRLILADALTYVQTHLNVNRIIDVATLTGACVVGLGSHHTGVWANDDTFYKDLDNASKKANELIWRMPLHDVFGNVLKHSIVADLVNSAAPNGGGANVAASFLQEFIEEKTQWIHLDIAGTSGTTGDHALCPKGATGVMVDSLSQIFK